MLLRAAIKVQTRLDAHQISPSAWWKKKETDDKTMIGDQWEHFIIFKKNQSGTLLRVPNETIFYEVWVLAIL